MPGIAGMEGVDGAAAAATTGAGAGFPADSNSATRFSSRSIRSSNSFTVSASADCAATGTHALIKRVTKATRDKIKPPG
jgi:hypothetical protein